MTAGVFMSAADQAGGDAPPAFLPARQIAPADLAAVTERGRLRVIRWFRLSRLLADLVPPPRKHRHRYHGVFAPNHKLRRAVTALAKRQRRQAALGRDGRA